MEHAPKKADPESRDDRGTPDGSPPPPAGVWPKVKHLVVHQILHLDDTPHRIAFGVFLGFLVGATPTIGIQMVIYVALAALLRANKVSGILPVWLSNPVTAVPLYYSNWRLGRFVLGEDADGDAGARIIGLLEEVPGQGQPLWQRLTSSEFWTQAIDTFVAMGAELWLGSLLVGVVCGIIGYWATYRGVIKFRARRAQA